MRVIILAAVAPDLHMTSSPGGSLRTRILSPGGGNPLSRYRVCKLFFSFFRCFIFVPKILDNAGAYSIGNTMFMTIFSNSHKSWNILKKALIINMKNLKQFLNS